MGATDIQVCNLALFHLGVGKRIAALDERGKEAEALNLVYEMARDEMLRTFAWPFSKRQAALALVSETGDTDHPTTEYMYSYRYPTDCLMIWKILSEVRNDSRGSRWSYELAADEQGTLIWTDREDAVMEYASILARNPARWQADFVMALSFRLAAYVAPLLTGGDPFKIGDKSLALWNRSNAQARATAGNEIQQDQEPDSEFILVRG